MIWLLSRPSPPRPTKPASSGRRCFPLAAILALLVACGGGKAPTTPDGTGSIVQLGPQVLRITPAFPCTDLTRGSLGFLLTRVSVSHSGDGWVAVSSSSDAGAVRLQFQESGPAVIQGSFPMAGTITGTATHLPDLLPSVPAWQLRATFSGAATLSGVAFAAGSLGTSASGLDGIGNGPLVLTDGAGNTCSGSAFSWAISSAF